MPAEEMGACSSACKAETPWKPMITTDVRNVVVNTLVVEPALYMVKDCSCKKCARVNKRLPNPEEATKHNGLLEEAKRAIAQTDDANKRKSVFTR